MAAKKTVTLADMTRRLGLEDHQQNIVIAYMNESGPWTEAQARNLIRAWHNDRTGQE